MAPSVPSIITHPACARDTERWLTRIATPVEHQRAVALLSSLPGAQADKPAPASENKDAAKKQKQRPVVAGGGKDWTYTTTRTARLSSAPGSPAQAWTQELLTDNRHTSAPTLAPPSQPATTAGGALPHEDYDYPSPPRPAAGGKQWGTMPAEVASAITAKQGGGKGSNTGSVALFGEDQSPDVTTYHLAFHLAQMHPELYHQALAATKAKPAVNGHFVSDWGDSLKRGVDAAWTARFLRSVYAITNDEVYPDPGPPSARGGAQPPGEVGFFKWLARQRTYYRDLIKDGMQQVVDQKLLGHGQHGTLDALRQLNAVARPELLISHSQATHHHMRTCEDPDLTALVRERTRVRTMGFPPPQIDGTYPTIASKMRDAELAASGAQPQQPANEPAKVDIVFGRDGNNGNGSGGAGRPMNGFVGGTRRPSSSAGRVAPRAPATAGERPRPASAFAALPGQGEGGVPTTRNGVKLTGPPVHLEKETFKSKLPIKWACATGLVQTSTYTQAFGSLAQGAGRRLASAGPSVPVRYKEVTCPIGAVNPVTAMAPPRTAYPVPECFTTTKVFPQGPGDATMATISRSAFAARDPADVARTLKASMEATTWARAEGARSTIPLGKGALCLLPSSDWVSEKQENFKQHKAADIAGDAARAAALKALMSGPTASAGKLTAKHPEPRAARTPVVAVA